MLDRFPALSIRQPYADLVVYGFKDVENRSRRINYRGPLLIHASLARPTQDFADHTTKLFRRVGILSQRKDWVPDLGAIVGIVSVIECVSKSDSEWFQGPFGWVLDEPESFDQAVPYKGAVGIFYVPRNALPARYARLFEKRAVREG